MLLSVLICFYGKKISVSEFLRSARSSFLLFPIKKENRQRLYNLLSIFILKLIFSFHLFKNFSKTHQNKIYLQERLPISITVRESFCSYFYYASFSFARAASVAKPSLSFTASSASIFLLISTFASFNPCMNLL